MGVRDIIIMTVHVHVCACELCVPWYHVSPEFLRPITFVKRTVTLIPSVTRRLHIIIQHVAQVPTR